MNRQDKNYQKLYQYSIRKRNWGVGSVVVGIFLAGMLQAPTVLANTGATASEPTIENQADTGGGATSGSEAAQPTATAPAPGAETTTPAPTPAPAELSNTRSSEAEVTEVNNVSSRESEQVTSLGPTVYVEVSKDKIRLEAPDVFHNTTQYPRGAQNLINGEIGDDSGANDEQVLTDLSWGGTHRLPQPVTFNFTEPQQLNRLEIYKRTGNNGTLTKYSVTVFDENHIDGETSEDQIVAYADTVAAYNLERYTNITKVILTFKEAKRYADGPNTLNQLTLKGVSFFGATSLQGEQIPKEDISITTSTPDSYQNATTRPDKLIDGKYSTKAELKWDRSGRLPQTMVLTPRNSETFDLSGLSVYKRSGDWGSLAKFTVVTKNGDNQVESKVITVPREATVVNVPFSGETIDRIELTVNEAYNSQGTIVHNELSLREIKLYKKVIVPITEQTPPAEG
ncbi:TPA: YSIRK-type signal peptide-containing protein, partial [Streptococcus suis]